MHELFWAGGKLGGSWNEKAREGVPRVRAAQRGGRRPDLAIRPDPNPCPWATLA